MRFKPSGRIDLFDLPADGLTQGLLDDIALSYFKNGNSAVELFAEPEEYAKYINWDRSLIRTIPHPYIENHHAAEYLTNVGSSVMLFPVTWMFEGKIGVLTKELKYIKHKEE